MIKQWNQRFTAFEREAFLPDKFGVQITFQRFGGGQALHDAAAHGSIVSGLSARAFQATLYPALLLHIADVHVFRTDAAAISLAQLLENFAQGHARAAY